MDKLLPGFKAGSASAPAKVMIVRRARAANRRKRVWRVRHRSVQCKRSGWERASTASSPGHKRGRYLLSQYNTFLDYVPLVRAQTDLPNFFQGERKSVPRGTVFPFRMLVFPVVLPTACRTLPGSRAPTPEEAVAASYWTPLPNKLLVRLIWTRSSAAQCVGSVDGSSNGPSDGFRGIVG